jgi:hypothetical protein
LWQRIKEIASQKFDKRDRCGGIGLRARSHVNLSPSIGIYRPQADVFGGRSDGKFVVGLGKDEPFQILISAGDN